MELTTKYSPKSTVWFIRENRIQNTVVMGIHKVSHLPLKDGSYKTTVQYQCGSEIFNEVSLFESKEALVESLYNN